MFCTTVIAYCAGSGCQVPPGHGVVPLVLALAQDGEAHHTSGKAMERPITAATPRRDHGRDEGRAEAATPRRDHGRDEGRAEHPVTLAFVERPRPRWRTRCSRRDPIEFPPSERVEPPIPITNNDGLPARVSREPIREISVVPENQ